MNSYFNMLIVNSFIFLLILKTGSVVSQVYSTIITAVILILSIFLLKNINHKAFFKLFSFLTIIYVIFALFHPFSDFTYKVYIMLFYVSILSTYLSYKRELLIESFEKIFNFILLHSFINYFIILVHLYLFKLSFVPVFEIKEQVMSLFYIFNYYQPYGDFNGIFGLPRNIGLFWEPGILQVYLNLYLFFKLFVQSEDLNKKSILIISALFITQSTTGLIIMSMIIFTKFFRFSKKNIGYLCIFFVIFIITIYPYIANKILGDGLSSGLVRLSDMYVAYRVFIDNLLIGYGFNYFNPDLYFKLYEFYMYDLVESLNIPIFLIDEIIKTKAGSTHDYIKIGAVYGMLIFVLFNYGWYKFGKVFSTKPNLFFIIIVLFVSLEPIGTAPFMVFLMVLGISYFTNRLKFF